jgi:hypothetical protein
MRATIVAAVLLCGALSLVTLDRASSLPGVPGRPAITKAGLIEEARAPRYRKARRYGHRRPYYVPYFCAPPYQYHYWQFYPPICYPL